MLSLVQGNPRDIPQTRTSAMSIWTVISGPNMILYDTDCKVALVEPKLHNLRIQCRA